MKKMSHTFTAFSAIAAVVRANLSGWYLLLALLFFSLFLTGCQTAADEELENTLQTTTCNVQATAVKVTCAYGAFDDTWLQLADGTYLHPWANATSIKELTEGQQYTIAYEQMERDNRYDELVRCMAALPEATIVNLTCLQPADAN